MTIAKDYQNEIKIKLSKILNLSEAEIEKKMKIPAYSPRVDIAIPPFAFERGYILEYRNLQSLHKNFLDKLIEKALNKTRIDLEKNPNPRCFMAIEIENSTGTDAKHILGSVTNVSFLGKIGIVITMNSKNYLNSINNYIEYVAQAGKIGNEFKNVILMHKTDFDLVLNEFFNKNN